MFNYDYYGVFMFSFTGRRFTQRTPQNSFGESLSVKPLELWILVVLDVRAGLKSE